MSKNARDTMSGSEEKDVLPLEYQVDIDVLADYFHAVDIFGRDGNKKYTVAIMLNVITADTGSRRRYGVCGGRE